MRLFLCQGQLRRQAWLPWRSVHAVCSGVEPSLCLSFRLTFVDCLLCALHSSTVSLLRRLPRFKTCWPGGTHCLVRGFSDSAFLTFGAGQSSACGAFAEQGEGANSTPVRHPVYSSTPLPDVAPLLNVPEGGWDKIPPPHLRTVGLFGDSATDTEQCITCFHGSVRKGQETERREQGAVTEVCDSTGTGLFCIRRTYHPRPSMASPK